MLIQALDASRRSQADRELHYYRHLVDSNEASLRCVELSKPTADHSPPRRSRGRRIAMVFAIAILAVVASLQIVGGILIANRSTSRAGESIALRGD
jgi:hypothetical protein